MEHEWFAVLGLLTDDEMRASVQESARHARRSAAELIARLAEVESRGLHLADGYASMFVYCTRALGFSEDEACTRIEVARVARRFPYLLDLLAVGELHMTAVRRLAPRLTDENHRQLLESARGKTRMQIEELLAALDPKPDVAASIRRLSVTNVRPATPPAASLPIAVVARPRPAVTVAPLSPDRYRLQVTIAGDTVEKLRLAQDLLRHAVPSGDPAVVLERALDLLVRDLLARKFAVTQKSRPRRGSDPHSRHIDAEVKRAVTLRDRGRCVFVGREGRRCNERAFLEFHHRCRPYAEGGGKGVDDIELRCRAHNAYESELFLSRRRAFKDELSAALEKGEGGH